MKAFGGLGIYPCERRLPGGHRLRVGGGAGVEDGGKSVVWCCCRGDDGDRVRISSSSVST